MMTFRKTALLAGASTLLFALASPAMADPNASDPEDSPADQAGTTSQTPQTTGSAESTTEGENILVTARRRQENAQRVPTAITALSGAELERRQITQTTDLVTVIPSLTIQPATSQRQSGSVTIRGQGQAYTGVLPSVITYLADVPLDPNGGAAFSTLDLENVQVLRGPQGTLFGRNTTGGAVLFVPRAPSHEFEGEVSLSVGNYGLFDVRGAINIPITATLSLRLAAQSVDRRGFTRNLSTGRALDNQNFQIARAYLRWEPTAQIRNDLIVSGLRADENGTGYVVTEIFNNGRAAFNYQNGAFRTAFAQQQARGPRAVDSNEDLGARRRLFFLADTFTWEFAHNINFRNIFGYQRTKTCYGTDLDSTTVPLNLSTCFPNRFQRSQNLRIYDDTDLRQFTDEAHLFGNALDDRLQWIVGGFFLDVQTPGGLEQFRLNRVSKSAASVNLGSTVIHDESRAVFAQGTFAILDNLHATAGFRYTWDSRAASTGTVSSSNEGATYSCVSPSLPGQPHTAADPIPSCYTIFRQDFSDYGYTFGLDWQVTPRTLLYAVTRRGYKSGGFNTVNNISFASFGPETFTDYELGIKHDWTAGIFSGRLNAAGFYGYYGNIQRNYNVLINGATRTIIVAQAAANVWGGELEGYVNVGDHFQISGFYSHLDYSYVNGTYTQPTTGQDISSSRFQAIARDSGSVTARAYTSLSDGSELSLSGTMYATSSIAFSSDTINNPTAIAPGYTIFSANLNWRNAFGRPLDLTAWVRNLTDKDYIVGGLGLQSVLGYTSVIYGEPRMYGVTATYHF